jgi:hypothetical protein
MKRAFLAGLTLALGALAILMSTASAEDARTPSSVNEVVPDNVNVPVIMNIKS